MGEISPMLCNIISQNKKDYSAYKTMLLSKSARNIFSSTKTDHIFRNIKDVTLCSDRMFCNSKDVTLWSNRMFCNIKGVTLYGDRMLCNSKDVTLWSKRRLCSSTPPVLHYKLSDPFHQSYLPSSCVSKITEDVHSTRIFNLEEIKNGDTRDKDYFSDNEEPDINNQSNSSSVKNNQTEYWYSSTSKDKIVDANNDNDLFENSDNEDESNFPELPSIARLCMDHDVLRRKLKDVMNIYILDMGMADVVAEKIIGENPEIPVIDCGAGPGVITRALLRRKAQRVISLYWKAEFLPYLKKLQQYVGEDRLHVDKASSSFSLRGSFGRLDKIPLLKDNIPQLWHTDPQLKFFLITRRFPTYVKYLNDCIAGQTAMFSLGRCEVFAFIKDPYPEVLTGDHFHGMKNSMKIQRITVCKTFFDIEILHKLPADAFFPNVLTKTEKIQLKKEESKDSCEGAESVGQFTLIKLVPKKNLHALIPAHLLPVYIQFVQFLLQKARQRLIPRMEQISPHCGLKLIKMGYTMTETTDQLSIDTIVSLFNEFSTWPEFPECILCMRTDSEDLGQEVDL